MGTKSRSESGMNIPDHISESLKTIFWDKYTVILWCGCGFGIQNLSDPGSEMERFGPGINIPDRNTGPTYQIHFCLKNRIWIGNKYSLRVPKLTGWYKSMFLPVGESPVLGIRGLVAGAGEMAASGRLHAVQVITPGSILLTEIRQQ